MAEGAFVVAGCGVFEWVFENPMCSAMFGCGCTFPWAGGWDNCNVHNPTGPRCPWCIAKGLGRVIVDERLVVTLMVLGWAAMAALGAKKMHDRGAERSTGFSRVSAVWIAARLLVPLLIFTLHALVTSFIMAREAGYPTWLWFHWPDTQVPSPPLPPYKSA